MSWNGLRTTSARGVAQCARHRSGGAVEAYIALGTLEAAEDMARHLLGEPARHYVLSQIAWARGDLQGVKEHLEHGSWIRCLEGPLAGETRWSRDFLANPSSVRLSPLLKEPITQIVRGQVALADEDITTAIELLQNGLKSLSGSPAPYLVGSESLADAWEKHGDAEQAVRVLASASQMRDRVYFGGIRAKTAWFRIEAERANLLRELGRDDEAARIEADLLKLLAVADDDHQILRDLKEQQARRTGAD